MRSRSALLAGLIVVAAACGDDGAATVPPATGGSTPPGSTESTEPGSTEPGSTAPGSPAPGEAPELDGHEYVSIDVTGHELVEGSQIRLSFDGERFGASGGCNQLGSTWSLDGDRLVVADMAMTEMACDPVALMDQDTWLASFLTDGPSVAVDGETLTLTGADATITLLDREVAEPDQALEGTTWTLDSIVTGDAVSSVPLGVVVPTLDFLDGQVEANTGCNTGSATYTVGDGTIELGPLALTRAACTEADGQAVEAAVVAALDGSPTYVIDADLLTLMNGDEGLVFRAMDTGAPAG